MKKAFTLILVLMLGMGLGACSSKSDDIAAVAYKTLDTGATLYNSTMGTVADLHRLGNITDDDYSRIRDAAEIYFSAYRIAADALYVYVRDKDESAQTKLNSAIQLVVDHLNDFIALAEAIGVNKDSSTPTTDTDSTTVVE